MKKFFRTLGGLAVLSFLAAVISCGDGATSNSPVNDALALEAAKSMVTIKYAYYDNANNVTQDVTLSSSSISGISGISVTWTSSNSEVIKIEGAAGKVTRPKADTKVTLTATLKKGKETATKPFDLTVIGTVSEQLRHIIGTVTPSKAVVYDSDPTLTLSNMVSGTTITWTSDKPDIIPSSVSGTVTVTLPAAKTAVVLTATATKEGISESRNFTVTVYPAGGAPTVQDLLSSIDFTAKKVSAGEQLTLPSEITGVPGTQITWTSDKPQSLTADNISSPKKATAHPDLRNVTVKLTATLEYNSQTASKAFDVTVERITEAKDPYKPNATYTFTDTIITHIETNTSSEGNTDTNGRKLTYTLDKEKRQITAHYSHILFDDGRWIAIGSAEHKQRAGSSIEEYLTQTFKEITALKMLSEKETVTLRDCGKALGLDLSLDEEGLYKELQNQNFIPEDLKYENFQKLSDEEKSAAIKQVIDSFKQKYINGFDLSSDANWANILNEFNKWAQQQRDFFKKEFQKRVNEALTPYVYEYKIQEVGSGSYSFEATTVYDRTKTWFKQGGEYSNNSSSYGEIAFRPYDFPNVGLHYNEQDYRGTLNSEGTEFKGKNSDDEEIICNITDNKDGTLSVTVNGSPYTLNFSGYKIG